MIVYPEIAIQNGRCVTLRKGQMVLPETHDIDPLTAAKQFEEQGAEWLHVVDLDARGRRVKDNTQLVSQIISEVQIPVQVAGGIHKPEHVDWWINRGAECVVIGSAAYLGPDVVRQAAENHPFRVLVSVDVKDGKVMVDGWTRPTETPPLEFLKLFDSNCLAGVIINDADYDIELPDGSVALVAELAFELKTPVIASGLTKTLDHVSTLKYLGNIAGAIVGRGLHQGVFTLSDAHRIALERDKHEALLRRVPNWNAKHSTRIPKVAGRFSEKSTTGPDSAPLVRHVESYR